MEKAKKPTLSSLHEDHKQWRLQLDFCEDEIAVFEIRLEELVQRFTGMKTLAELESYQNQFIRQKEVIDIIHHDIGVKHHELEAYSQKHHGVLKDHIKLRKDMTSFLRIYKELKHHYNQLLLKLL